MNKKPLSSESPTDHPPLLKSWRQFYFLLIGWLIVLIVLFYAFTEYFK